MIGIEGEDGAGYRWLPPKASDVRDGRLRVIPYPPRRRIALLGVLNSVAVIAVFACRQDERHGVHRGWHPGFYLAVLALLLVQAVLRMPGGLARRTLHVQLPLRLTPVPPIYWVERVQFLAALSVALLACIEADRPHPAMVWNLFYYLVSAAVVGVSPPL